MQITAFKQTSFLSSGTQQCYCDLYQPHFKWLHYRYKIKNSIMNRITVYGQSASTLMRAGKHRFVTYYSFSFVYIYGDFLYWSKPKLSSLIYTPYLLKIALLHHKNRRIWVCHITFKATVEAHTPTWCIEAETNWIIHGHY